MNKDEKNLMEEGLKKLKASNDGKMSKTVIYNYLTEKTDMDNTQADSRANQVMEVK